MSAVAADIGGVGATHVNHLTPRVLDIDELYRRMTALGIAMIDEIQGPPAWRGPDVLLRQTSFRALAEPRVVRLPDGTVTTGTLRVRFGEVEARGIALTRAGRALYDEMLGEIDRRVAGEPGRDRAEVAREVWAAYLPETEEGLASRGLGHFTYHVVGDRRLDEGAWPTATADLGELLRRGGVRAEPIVYEDFLPRSAAGIFQSNLSDEGSRDDAVEGAEYDLERLSGDVGRDILDPFDLYQAQEDRSLDVVVRELGLGAVARYV